MSLRSRHSVGLCSRRISFFPPHCPLSCLVTILHGSLRDGPLGLWEPSPLLGSALVGANKMGPCLQICRYIEWEGGDVGCGGWVGVSYFVEVCRKLGCHLLIGSSYSRESRGSGAQTRECRPSAGTAGRRPGSWTPESGQKAAIWIVFEKISHQRF